MPRRATRSKGRWIRLLELTNEPAEDQVRLMAVLMTELPIAETLVLMHGRERGIRRYGEAGGAVRIDGDGEVVVWSEAGRTEQSQGRGRNR